MNQFHQILDQQFASIDAFDASQREAVYAQARAALDKTIADDPGRRDLANYRSDLEHAIADVERRYASASFRPPPIVDERPPRSKRLSRIAAVAAMVLVLVTAGLWWFGALPPMPRTAGVPGEVKRVEIPPSGDPRKDLAGLGFADPELAWNAAFRDGDVRLLNLAIDSGYRLNTTQFPDAYLTLMMQPSKGLANPEFRNALHRLKDDIRPSICANVTLSNIVPVRDMIQQIGVEDYRFYCSANVPDFKAMRSEVSAQWQNSCRSLLPVEEMAQKKALDHDCAYDGFTGEEKIRWESLTTAETFKRLARIRDAIIELERQFQP